MNRRSGQRRRKRNVPWASIVFGSAALLSLPALLEEWRIAELVAAVSSNDPAAIAAAQVATAERASAREAMLSAQILARRAVQLPLAERKPVLDEADELLERADYQRPNWGQSFMIHAYVTGLRTDSVNDNSNQWLERSYRHAPFLYPEGAWRVLYGMSAWPSLDSIVQRQVLNEAVGLTVVGGASRTVVQQAMKDAPPAQDYRLLLEQEWARSRVD